MFLFPDSHRTRFSSTLTTFPSHTINFPLKSNFDILTIFSWNPSSKATYFACFLEVLLQSPTLLMLLLNVSIQSCFCHHQFLQLHIYERFTKSLMLILVHVWSSQVFQCSISFIYPVFRSVSPGFVVLHSCSSPGGIALPSLSICRHLMQCWLRAHNKTSSMNSFLPCTHTFCLWHTCSDRQHHSSHDS